jgi:diguanylate cyclase (GGDEF)-like protein
MKKPPAAPNEEMRLGSLKRLEILDTPPDERFERITRIAMRLFGVPMAAITLVDSNRQWFKSKQGIAVRETPRDVSFCAHAIAGSGMLVVADALKDARFADNPLVTGEPRIRFYAGQPLVMPDGMKVGTLCVMDRKAREFTREELQSLEDLAAWAEVEVRAVRVTKKQQRMETERAMLRDKATIDALTQVYNRPTILEVLEVELVRALRDDEPMAVVIADLDHFKKVNDTHGHPAGDAVLKEAARRMKTSMRPSDAVGRYGGEEFLIVLPGASAEAAARTAERIRAQVGAGPVEHAGRQIPVTMSLGVTAVSFPERVKVDRLIKAADEALYRAKKSGRNRVEVTT